MTTSSIRVGHRIGDRTYVPGLGRVRNASDECARRVWGWTSRNPPRRA